MRNTYLTSTLLIIGSACCQPSHPQPAMPARALSANAGAVLPLPPPVTRLVAIDAHNILLAESTDPNAPDQKQYDLVTVRHVYPGGIARIFGGTVVPASTFVSPAGNMMQNNGGMGLPAGVGLNSFNGANQNGAMNGMMNGTMNGSGGPFNNNPSNNSPSNGQGMGGPGNFTGANWGALQQIVNLLDRAPRQVQIGR